MDATTAIGIGFPIVCVIGALASKVSEHRQTIEAMRTELSLLRTILERHGISVHAEWDRMVQERIERGLDPMTGAPVSPPAPHPPSAPGR